MTWETACCATASSVSLDRNCKLLTGRKFFFISSRLGFLIVGFTSAPFHSSGKSPDSRERLMIDEIAGDNSSTHCLTIVVGSGSLAHDFEGALVISFCTEANGMLLNFEKGVPLNVEDEQRIYLSCNHQIKCMPTSVCWCFHMLGQSQRV